MKKNRQQIFNIFHSKNLGILVSSFLLYCIKRLQESPKEKEESQRRISTLFSRKTESVAVIMVNQANLIIFSFEEQSVPTEKAKSIVEWLNFELSRLIHNLTFQKRKTERKLHDDFESPNLIEVKFTLSCNKFKKKKYYF